MTLDRIPKTGITLVAVILTCAALMSASSVFAPLALALFVIALVWPMQNRIESMAPKGIALLACMAVILLAFSIFGWLIVWAVSRISRAMIADSAKFQAMYEQINIWVASHGVDITTLWSDHFNVGWMLRAAQAFGSRLNNLMSFSVIALVYVLLGLLEVNAFRVKIKSMKNRTASEVLLNGLRVTSYKLRRYTFVRSQMSLITGLLVFMLTYAIGLPLAKEWGVIAFVLNFIPFLGPFFATLLPTLYSAAEFQSWQATLGLFIGLNAIQSTVGSYVEPRVSGSALSISPFIVLLSIFFWTYMWGIFGAFIGVPITIAILSFCAQHSATEWIGLLLANGALAVEDDKGDAQA
ncbi:MAG: AI-2E family transporter [Beijerinckiaceae bacterium]|nr:AI-2E family transporter [Beijerinckiaceae bacterium]